MLQAEGSDSFSCIVAVNEACLHYYILEMKMESRIWKHSIWPAHTKFKRTVSVAKAMTKIFWDIPRIIHIDFTLTCYDSDCSCVSHDIINAWRKHFSTGDKAAYLRCVACLLTYLLTYSMEQSPWEANRFSGSQAIPHSVWNLKVHNRFHKCLPSVPIKVCCYCTVMLGHILLTPPQPFWTLGICKIFPIYHTACLNFHIFGRLKTHLWSQWFLCGKTIRA
jgi:hypothetical protein